MSGCEAQGRQRDISDRFALQKKKKATLNPEPFLEVSGCEGHAGFLVSTAGEVARGKARKAQR